MIDWKSPPLRLQIVCNGRLIAEVIAENSHEVENIWSKWVTLRLKKDSPVGGSMISRADIPRYWNIPVGSFVGP